MEYPCYQIQAITEGEKIEQVNYIIKKLKSFGYNIRNEYLYTPITNLIVINDCGIFGDVNNTYPENIKNHNRYLVSNFNEFLLIAAKLKNATFKPNKNKINMENNTSQTKELKVGDKVLVKNKKDEYFQSHIYIGKIHNKYACVHRTYENEFNQNKPVTIAFWDEMITELKVTKAQIAEKFGVSVDQLIIVD